MMLTLPGTYTLVFHSSEQKPVDIGQLGTLVLQPGFYLYVGSAFGPGGLKARITHHRRRARRPHWHMDYLRPALKLCEIWYTYDRTRREHQWARIHAQTRGARLPLPGFGSADCGCPTHLFFYPSQPSGGHFRRKIRAKLDNPTRFMIEKLQKNFLTKTL